MIELFSHNQSAYESVLSMLDDARKACVIHPTGTGKSFIAFKYCEDHPEQAVLWISPSEYIFKTQCENLLSTGAKLPENIRFMTYARLSQLSQEELDALRPALIVLDEMHRAAAPTWERPVQALLSRQPAPLALGLTATSIRYLDGQRDTAALFFDSNIASEMSLGEAIARGILHAPRYVLTSFSLEAGLKKYRSRIQRAKSALVREEGERLLDALRRALDRADGLDRVFQKHITQPAGKYLVFCANVAHMQEMLSHVPEWFGRIDPEAHVYSAHSHDPAASKAFRAFKEDRTEGHLKLLFTIDMLNEGVHVEDVSGVILFRPTVSPIIYKQQIGRALSASGAAEPVIFDVVNNIENLYSIGSVEQEVRDAVFLLRERGEREAVCIDRFEVIDEVRDCRELFYKLDETLTASWDMMFACARRFYEENGHLLVPRRYHTPENYALGNWILTQRKVRDGRQYGRLDERRIALLDSIGMVWEEAREVSWKRYYSALCHYRAQHGNLDIKADYVDENGVRLGTFITNIRSARRDGRSGGILTKERMQQLDALGMIWDSFDHAWEQNYQACAQYYMEHGNLNIPAGYACNGLRIGAWLRRQRMLRDKRVEGTLTPERIHRLDAIGMVWTDAFTNRWNYGYAQACQWYKEHGDLNVPSTYVNASGFPLGKWLKRHIPNENGKTAITVTPEKRKKLDAIGMVWDRPEDSWEMRYALVKAFHAEYGHLNIPPQYKASGVWISKWLNEQRQIYIGNRPGKQLTEDQIRRLEALGMTWENRREAQKEAAWQRQYAEAKRYYLEHGDLTFQATDAGANGKRLKTWLSRQQTLQAEGKLSREQVALLEALGVQWSKEDPWEIGYRHAEAYYRSNGNLLVPGRFLCEDGYRLGNWIASQRSRYGVPRDSVTRGGSEDEPGAEADGLRQVGGPDAQRRQRLDAIGMEWSLREAQWQEGFRHAEEYLRKLAGKPWKVLYVSDDGYRTGEWLRTQYRAMQKGSLRPERKARLAALGFLNTGRSAPRQAQADRLPELRSGGE